MLPWAAGIYSSLFLRFDFIIWPPTRHKKDFLTVVALSRGSLGLRFVLISPDQSHAHFTQRLLDQWLLIRHTRPVQKAHVMPIP